MAVHVLWVIKGLGPGGAERLLAGLATAHDPSVATFECAYVVAAKSHLVGQLEAAGVPCECMSRSARDWSWPLRLARLVRSGDFDVVHVHSPLPGSVARLAVRSMPRAHRPRIYTTEHNAWNTFRRPTRWLNRLTGRGDKFTFAVSAEVAGSLRGPVVDRSEVLVHGIDLRAVEAQRDGRASMRRELGVRDDELLVATVANFRQQKDYPTLLAACARLRERGVPLRLVAVGQGPLEAEMRALHASLGLGDRVVLTGYHPDPPAVLAAADVFVLASRWEGLPVAMMEAAALGLPMVLTEVGGMPDALGVEGAEWVAPGRPDALADALQGVLADPTRRAALAQRSQEAAAAFDVGRAARVIEAKYVPPIPRWAPPVGMDGLVVRRATPADEREAIALCGEVLGHEVGETYAAFFHWKHFDNPFGQSPMWVAVDDGRIVAVRVFLRWQFVRNGVVVPAVRAVDTATHASHQGRGLFTALTLQGIRELTDEGVQMVFNTPNDKSRPGYLKMGWQEVGRLAPVASLRSVRGALRSVRSRVPASLHPEPISVGADVNEWLRSGGLDRSLAFGHPAAAGTLSTPITPEYVAWRFGSPLQPCRVIEDDRATVIVERRRRGEVIELVCMAAFGSPRAIDRLLRRTLRPAEADLALRLGSPAPLRGFLPLPGVGPRLTCRMLGAEPTPALPNWSLSLGDVVLF
ncbi:MAG: GNAT family N-acetyltransferase [Ilumatobacteraceae bacterium]